MNYAAWVRRSSCVGICFGAGFGFMLGRGPMWLGVWDLPIRVGPQSPLFSVCFWTLLSVGASIAATAPFGGGHVGPTVSAALVGTTCLLTVAWQTSSVPAGLFWGAVAFGFAFGLSVLARFLSQAESLRQRAISLVAFATLGVAIPSPLLLVGFREARETNAILRSADDLARREGLHDYQLAAFVDSGYACARIYLERGAILECEVEIRPRSHVTECKEAVPAEPCESGWQWADGNRL